MVLHTVSNYLLTTDSSMEFLRGLTHLYLTLPFLNSVVPMVTNSNSESPFPTACDENVGFWYSRNLPLCTGLIKLTSTCEKWRMKHPLLLRGAATPGKHRPGLQNAVPGALPADRFWHPALYTAYWTGIMENYREPSTINTELKALHIKRALRCFLLLF